ncbi:MAG: DUF4373 domain-containing protein [Hymenobacter sp.]|nr:DUF4373 domain-containing protein [Hymenobacter sp.]
MARPARFNADYFTHSADLRNDRRVKAIRTAFGAAGYGIFTMLLEALTDADNTALAVDEMELELLAGDFGVSATEIHSLLQFGVKVGYFATNEAGFLTCPELTGWLAPVFEKRNRARNASTAALPPHPVSETGVSVTVNPQSKVKESKVNTTDVVAAAPEPLPAKITPKQLAAAHTDPADLQPVTDCPLAKPHALRAIFREAGYPDADPKRYALQIAAKSTGLHLTASQWKARIINFLNNDARDGHLLKVAGAGQTPNEVPSNWDTARQGPYTAPMGQGIPHPSSFLKPGFLPS